MGPWTVQRSCTRSLGSEASTRGLCSPSCEVYFEAFYLRSPWDAYLRWICHRRSCLDRQISLGTVHATALTRLALYVQAVSPLSIMDRNEDGGAPSIFLVDWPSRGEIMTVAMGGEWQVGRNCSWRDEWEERVT